MPDEPQVVMELLLPALVEIHRFSLDGETCWRSSAAFNFAIIKVPVSRSNKLALCHMSIKAYDTINVDVFGFTADLQGEHFEHDYAIILSQTTD
ncbi:hypothetical protein DVH05_004109 [Phytophthora capsici]|nr:hypothetical protein DVH05_004109 [Phytophthora capsici]